MALEPGAERQPFAMKPGATDRCDLRGKPVQIVLHHLQSGEPVRGTPKQRRCNRVPETPGSFGATVS